MINIIIIALIGIIVGLLSGITGIFFLGTFIVPFKYLNIGDNKTIIGTVLYTLLFPLTFGSVYQFYKEKKINFFVGNILLLTIIIGGYFGTKLILDEHFNFTEKKINYLSAFISFIGSIQFFISGYYS